MVSLGDDSLTALLSEELRIRARDHAFERALASVVDVMTAARFGVIGLGTMGRNLALNIESRGVPVAVWNLEPEWVDDFLRDHAGHAFVGTKTLESLVAALERPRRILMMIPAGKPVDQTIDRLRPLLDPGDVLIDGGNSWFEDTRRREAALRATGIHFVGCGVSGGEEGARFGPSIMPGGSAEAWEASRTCSRRLPPGPMPGHASRTSAPTAPVTSSRWSTTASSTATCSSLPSPGTCCGAASG